ncbi:4-phosphoerythronate dehydrogenase [Aliidiomarina sanyensis]|uniref:Erythronate-4-phosphate dehydrogenase n=1 Tax=Aliidiomarina sanyensis TaxID=1249555 RepID=A0A432WDK7_9GAMM|nr:4-phosphoerythronate dehydrogenase [Aliidiomarina sanyensis]RUO30490.1 4-phosphoerythronate dehydrogenase [Aliidiomarina sanyensis]
MNFLIDENLLAAESLFGAWGELQFFSGREIPRDLLVKAEVLLVRSTTSVDASVLSDAPHLRFVGTATIGSEHIDQAALISQGIKFSNAPGCNAIAVAEYVLAAILTPEVRQGRDWRGKKAVIIGAGNTGSATGRRLAALGMDVCYVDPFLAAGHDSRCFGGMQMIERADLVSLHVPYTQDGAHPTHHMFDGTVLNSMRSDAVLLNASRGAVIDNQALFALLQKEPRTVVLDVWEGEPEVLAPLVPHITIATPHIAGHSVEGKVRGSYMLYDVLHAEFQLTDEKIPLNKVLPQLALEGGRWETEMDAPDFIDRVTDAVLSIYDPRVDDQQFRARGQTPEGFDELRKQYKKRRELSALRFYTESAHVGRLRALGFTVESD